MYIYICKILVTIFLSPFSYCREREASVSITFSLDTAWRTRSRRRRTRGRGTRGTRQCTPAILRVADPDPAGISVVSLSDY